ncbi:MAG: hypothetical protein E6Q76_14735 [Rhizobium sp.]|nr:MAG: hypothetical protein E6Q76_14735 [Rhizobium sp.]
MANEDKKAQKAVESQPKKEPVRLPDNPAAGPHAKEHLIDDAKTPGGGTLPDTKEESVDPGAG